MTDLEAPGSMRRVIFLFDHQPDWALIFWASYAAWVVMELWLLRRDARPVQGEEMDRGSRYALMVLIPAGLLGAFAAPHILPRADIESAVQSTFYIAIVCIWIGVVLRLWAVATLGRHFRTSVFVQTDHELVTSGPYRVLRHPSYTGALITMVGVGLAIGNWLSVIISVGCLLIAVAVRIRVEDRALAEHFGADFAGHKLRTWTILPFIW
jgi:protein-S-isoprenylcysteine O-methyltransferase